MEEKRNWWEEGLRMAGANFGEVVAEKSSAAEQEKAVRTCGCTCVRVCFPVDAFVHLLFVLFSLRMLVSLPLTNLYETTKTKST